MENNSHLQITLSKIKQLERGKNRARIVYLFFCNKILQLIISLCAPSVFYFEVILSPAIIYCNFLSNNTCKLQIYSLQTYILISDIQASFSFCSYHKYSQTVYGSCYNMTIRRIYTHFSTIFCCF